MRKRWLAVVENHRKRGAAWAVVLRHTAGKQRNGEIVIHAEGERLIRAAAEQCGHEYIISKMDAGKPVRITSRNRIWLTEPGKELRELLAAPSANVQKTQRQPQRQTQPRSTADDVAELKDLLLALAEKIDRLS